MFMVFGRIFSIHALPRKDLVAKHSVHLFPLNFEACTTSILRNMLFRGHHGAGEEACIFKHDHCGFVSHLKSVTSECETRIIMPIFFPSFMYGNQKRFFFIYLVTFHININNLNRNNRLLNPA